MVQTTLYNENPCVLYQSYVNTPLEQSSISMKYAVFQSLSLHDIKVLKLPSTVHRQILNIKHLVDKTSVEQYLDVLNSLIVHADSSREMYMLFYMINYVLLYIQLYDAGRSALYNKLYALALCCFDYNCLREGII